MRYLWLITAATWLTAVTLIPPAAAGANHPRQIIRRIETLAGASVTRWCRAADLTYPLEAVLFRVFKHEGRLEIWGKNTGMRHMRKIRTLRVCAVDRTPGPKTIRGDGKTPEGVYRGRIGYGSRYDWMWIDLNPNRVGRPGRVGVGHAFKICIDYPNSKDRARSASVNANPGGGICLHGNCVTAGCVSLTNRDFLAVFAFAHHHQTRRYGPFQVHLYPFDFATVTDVPKIAEESARGNTSEAARLLQFWMGLAHVHHRFEQNPNPVPMGDVQGND